MAIRFCLWLFKVEKSSTLENKDIPPGIGDSSGEFFAATVRKNNFQDLRYFERIIRGVKEFYIYFIPPSSRV